ncbi:hypothetical protein GCM10010254_34620 [Streptomyces chromofuscus]|nr:hypothetical protein GCM10010254_34620 [Streptomyces chromofuscus]
MIRRLRGTYGRLRLGRVPGAAHGGTVGLTSEPGATVFTVRLPANAPIRRQAASEPRWRHHGPCACDGSGSAVRHV